MTVTLYTPNMLGELCFLREDCEYGRIQKSSMPITKTGISYWYWILEEEK